jgi:phosphatidylglycerol:prolipoprotein diacylglycerol transferase
VVAVVGAPQRRQTSSVLSTSTGGLRPVLFEWLGIRIHSYPAMLYLGLTLGAIAGDYAAHIVALPPDRLVIGIMLLTIPGFLGSRLLFIAINWTVYRREPRRIWRRSEGGSAMLGGLVLAVAVSPPLLSVVSLPFCEFWDVATFVALISLIFGRVGCHLHGCCSGRPSAGPFTLELPNYRGVYRRRIPTQLLEAGWGLFLLSGAVGLWKHAPVPGALFLFTVAGYGAGRIVLQQLREQQERLGALNIQQGLCVGMIGLSLIGLLLLWHGHGPGL